MFFISHEETGNSAAIVEIDGALNSETSSDFEDYTSTLAENGMIYLLINSEKINFISSAGIGAVLLLHRKISAFGGAVVFFGLSREISLLFHLLGFDRLIRTAVDRKAALSLAADFVSDSGSRSSLPDEFVPFVIECLKCSSPVRVSMKGDHYCPYCSAPFTVNGEGNAIFKANA
jgi:anti-sigma B factor antagonist